MAQTALARRKLSSLSRPLTLAGVDDLPPSLCHCILHILPAFCGRSDQPYSAVMEVEAIGRAGPWVAARAAAGVWWD